MKPTTLSKFLLLALGSAIFAAEPAKDAYVNDFQKAELGKPAEELFLLNGAFAVKEESGNRFLELPGDPIDTFGFLFGPEGHKSLDVSARIQSTSNGKLFPEFGIGTNDAGGIKFFVLPGQKKLVVRRGDDPTPIAEASYADWQSGQWTNLRLRVTAGADGKPKVEAKAWGEGKEPDAWQITAASEKALDAGRATAWGIPHADTAIRFDDLKATPLD